MNWLNAIWLIVAGAMLTNLRYWFLYRKFQRKYFVIPKKHSAYRNVLSTHFRGQTRDGQKFVYCPDTLMVSWNPGDYDHEWCHACQAFFSEHVEQLLTPEEQERIALK